MLMNAVSNALKHLSPDPKGENHSLTAGVSQTLNDDHYTVVNILNNNKQQHIYNGNIIYAQSYELKDNGMIIVFENDYLEVSGMCGRNYLRSELSDTWSLVKIGFWLDADYGNVVDRWSPQPVNVHQCGFDINFRSIGFNFSRVDNGDEITWTMRRFDRDIMEPPQNGLPYDEWWTSMSEHNRLMHATNGNTSSDSQNISWAYDLDNYGMLIIHNSMYVLVEPVNGSWTIMDSGFWLIAPYHRITDKWCLQPTGVHEFGFDIAWWNRTLIFKLNILNGNFVWTLTQVDRNRLMHSMNGNINLGLEGFYYYLCFFALIVIIFGWIQNLVFGLIERVLNRFGRTEPIWLERQLFPYVFGLLVCYFILLSTLIANRIMHALNGNMNNGGGKKRGGNRGKNKKNFRNRIKDMRLLRVNYEPHEHLEYYQHHDENNELNELGLKGLKEALDRVGADMGLTYDQVKRACDQAYERIKLEFKQSNDEDPSDLLLMVSWSISFIHHEFLKKYNKFHPPAFMEREEKEIESSESEDSGDDNDYQNDGEGDFKEIDVKIKEKKGKKNKVVLDFNKVLNDLTFSYIHNPNLDDVLGLRHKIVAGAGWMFGFKKPMPVVMMPLTNVKMIDDPQPTRSFEPEAQRILVLDYVYFNIVEIKNESLSTAFSTPDIISKMVSSELYETQIRDIVRIPSDYLTFSASYFSRKSLLNEEEYHLFCIQTVKYAECLIMSPNDYVNLVVYGPRIAIKHYRPYFLKLSSTVRTERQNNKIHKMSKFINFIKNLMWSVKCFSFSKFLYPKINIFYQVISGGVRTKDYLLSERFYNVIDATAHSNIAVGLINTSKETNNILYKMVKFPRKLFIDFHKSYPWLTESIDMSINGVNTILPNWLENVLGNFCQFFMFRVPFLTTIFGILITNPVQCLISPCLEEYTRSGFSTIFYSVFESLFTGSIITVPLHCFNYWFMNRYKDYDKNLITRVLIHSLFNILITFSFGPQYAASSMLSSTIGFIYSKFFHSKHNNTKRFIKDAWGKIKTENCMDSVLPYEPRNINLVDTDPFRKPNFLPLKQYIVGPCDKDYKPIAFDTSKHNERIAIEARILKQTPPIDQIEMKEFKKWVQRNYKRIFPKTTHSKVISLTPDQYLKGSNASPTVKLKLKETFLKLKMEGISDDLHVSKQLAKKWVVRKSFVKNENLNYRTPIGIFKKAPRLIQGAKPEFICLVGPWIASLQNHIKRDWNDKNFLCFTSGVKAHNAAKLVSKYPYYLEDDVSAWDASCSEELLEIEFWLFKKFGCPTGCKELIELNINTIGMTGKGWKYRRKGCRKSGDPYTSLGNSILNGLIHLYIFCRHVRCGIRAARNKITMLIQGDDSLINLDRKYRINWKNEMLKFGFKAEALLKTNRNYVEFCSMRIYNSKDGPVFGPIAGKVIAKFGIFCNPSKNAHPLSLLRGSALGLFAAASPVPVLREYLLHIINLTEGHEALNMISDEWRMVFKKCDGTFENLLGFNDVYGLDTHSLDRVKEEIHVLQLDSVNMGTYLKHILDRDTSGPKVFLHFGC